MEWRCHCAGIRGQLWARGSHGGQPRRQRHQTIREQGQWLGAVLKGYYAYFAVPTNVASLRATRHHVKVRWRMALQQRSQRQRMGWRRMERLADRYLPQPSILHPWPQQRFLVKHSR